jgi:hypothetical protein
MAMGLFDRAQRKVEGIFKMTVGIIDAYLQYRIRQHAPDEEQVRSWAKDELGYDYNRIEDLIDSRIEEKMDDMRGRIQRSIRQQLDEKCDDVDREVSSALEKIDTRMDALETDVRSTLNDDIETLTDHLQEQFGDLQDSLPEKIEETLDDILGEIADEVASSVQDDLNPGIQENNRIQVQELDPLPSDHFEDLSELQRQIYFVIQRRYERGNESTSYRDAHDVLGDFDPSQMTELNRLMEKEGWVDRRTSPQGSLYKLNRRVPEEYYDQYQNDIAI